MEKSAECILAAVILHNICVDCSDNAFDIDDEEFVPANDVNGDGPDEDQSAKAKRNQIADLLNL